MSLRYFNFLNSADDTKLIQLNTKFFPTVADAKFYKKKTADAAAPLIGDLEHTATVKTVQYFHKN